MGLYRKIGVQEIVYELSRSDLSSLFRTPVDSVTSANKITVYKLCLILAFLLACPPCILTFFITVVF